MKPFPFKLPVRIEDRNYLVAEDNELILKNWDATSEELDAIVTAINGYAEAVKLVNLLEPLVNYAFQETAEEEFMHASDKARAFLEKLK